MSFRDNLHQTDEYQAMVGEANADGPPPGQQGQQSGGPDGPAGLGPVLTWEKTDVQFWTDVATVILLFLIWRELRRREA